MLNALLQYQQPGIRIGTFTIYAYAIIIVCGMIAAFFLISLLFRRRNMSKDLFLTYFCVTLPIALFTTRLFYCITDRVPFEYWFSFTLPSRSAIRREVYSVPIGEYWAPSAGPIWYVP